ncbi:Retrovirus-related Pol polyprotein from transposon TNT 1-94 [Araneus ventricosus]|uniref:Retrovirus-related Pol polyprotein from transposon TNT 1-94 n=1 Tax=Araneus ventricosus TaxID=182803 RepID=A0A4Y2XA13_ARAVE|nr:Retrovirus-related Pol polyprotein from transposon TNT 1-94 [Araneus ventricosus]
MPAEVLNPDLAFTSVERQRQRRVCYFCRKLNHVMKDYFIRKRIEAQKKSRFYNSSRKNKDLEALDLSSEERETSSKHVWILDSGASTQMVKDRIWFENFVSSASEVFLAGKDSKFKFCGLGKITRKFHPPNTNNQSNDVLELIHADLCGPVDVESLGGFKYFLIIVDDYSGMYFSFFFRSKTEVISTFEKFKAKYENLRDKRIKRLRTDNGLEFLNKEIIAYLNKFGIMHEKTIPYNAESNGKAERAIRVTAERARIALYESNLPLNFWAEEVAYNTQVSNLTPRKGKAKLCERKTWI